MTSSVPDTAPPPAAPPRIPTVALVDIAGDLRYLSHHDELRMDARAVVRARWPIAYSAGFNPLPRLRIPAPRPVGVAAHEQVILIDLDRAEDAAALHERLAAALPTGCTLRRVITPATRRTPHPLAMRYALPLPPALRPRTAARVRAVLAASHCPVQRDLGPSKPTRTIDIRPYIETLQLTDDTLHASVRVVDQRTARPQELLTVLDLDAEPMLHRLQRTSIQWDIELSEPAAATDDTREESGIG